MGNDTEDIERIFREKLGDVKPNILKKKTEGKDLTNIINGMNQRQKTMLNYVLNNPDALKAFLASPQATELLKGLKGE